MHAGADASNIKLDYKGASKLSLEDGALNAVTPLGTIIEQKPYSYSIKDRKTIASSFLLSGQQLSFSLDPGNGDVVIDPQLLWGTLFGDSGPDEGEGICTDATGNPVFGGTTASSANIATIGSYQSTFAGGYDAYLAKFNPSGQPIWATYMGSSALDEGHAIAADGLGNLYICGFTQAPGQNTAIATPGAHQTSLGGGKDVFLVKFNSAGSRLWGTFMGGTLNDEGQAVTVDPANNVYICGSTQSTTAMATPLSLYPAAPGYIDGFVAKFNASGVRIWSTYYGGTDADYCMSLCTDNVGHLYMGGQSGSPSGVATPGSYQPVFSAGPTALTDDAVIVQFDTAGNRLWGTYYGSYGEFEGVTAMECDASNALYITGYCELNTIFSTPGAYQPAYAGGAFDGFLAKFTSAGQRTWGTFFGGTGLERLEALALDGFGSVFVGGYTESHVGISSPGSYQPSLSQGKDGFWGQFNTNTGQRILTSYYGGIFDDGIYGISRTGSGGVYLTGRSSSPAGIATAGAYLATNPLYDTRAFLARLTGDTLVVFVNPGLAITATTGVCPTSVIYIPFTTTSPFNAGNVFTIQLSNAAGSFATPVTIGSVVGTGSDSIACTIPAGTPAGTAYRVRIVASSPVYVSDPNGANLVINSGTVPATPTTTGPSQLCLHDTLTLTASSATAGVTYSWKAPSGLISSLSTYYKANLVNYDSGYYRVTAKLGNCISSPAFHHLTLQQNIINSIAITSSAGNVINAGTSVTFTANITNGGTSPAVVWYKNAVVIPGASGLTYSTNTLQNNDTIYARLYGNAQCKAPAAPFSNKIRFTVFPVHVPVVQNDKLACSLYPNPNNGSFVFSIAFANVTARSVNISVIDAVGRTVYEKQSTPVGSELSTTIDLPASIAKGLYLLRFSNGDASGDLPFLVK